MEYSKEYWLSNCNKDKVSELRTAYEFIVGPPEETDYYTVEQLTRMGMIGIYKKNSEENRRLDRGEKINKRI